MTNNVATRGVKQVRKLALPLALSLAFVSLSAHAETAGSWIEAQKSLVASARADVQGAKYTAREAELAAAANGAGSLDASQTVDIAVALNLRNEAGLDAFNKAVNDPQSPQYGKFLSGEQFVQQYGPTQAQVDAVVAHLKQAGFQNIAVSANRLLVNASGSPAAVAAAFRTNLVAFHLGGRQVYANDASVSVPAALGGVVKSVLGLDNLARIHTYHYLASPQQASARVKVNAATGGTESAHNPTTFPAIYDVGSTPTASNTSVGIITWGSDAQTLKDLKTFASNNGLSAVTASVVKTGKSGSTYSDDVDNGDVEWDLDSQTIVGVSGGVKQLLLYTAPYTTSGTHPTLADLTNAYNGAVTANVAKVINVSLGVNEADATGQSADDAVFKQAVAQGQTFSVAAGDAGVYQWSTDSEGGGPGYVANSSGTVEINLGTYSVSEPATSPNVIAVGGTALYTSGTTYVSESTWNEGLEAIDSPYDNNQRLWATGGGVSANETAPSWQTSALGSSITHRVVPDLAFDAAYDSGTLIVWDGQSNEQVGGTSLASPIFVGIWARVQSGLSNALGFPASSLYTYLPANSSLLHDVTSGNNGYNGYGYNAAVGWDYTTGWGSLDISNFYNFVQSTSNFAR
ncbi:S53 family peptidase [Dyella acidiphila]|uniref:S8/S53 family peptidase n=1 Tax=Dyella acidiphila TaxID=2775866 RepID=A0ABR9G6N7_9GAMM|nr:S53 family peptidase [Dyella acidiphila]MBE1159672.1 S8/S53 family peptidase [Dyella acidiphila]